MGRHKKTDREATRMNHAPVMPWRHQDAAGEYREPHDPALPSQKTVITPTPGADPSKGGPGPRNLLKEIGNLGGQLDQQVGALISGLTHPHGTLKYDGDVDEAYAFLKTGLGRSADIIIRRFTIGGEGGVPAVLVFEDGLASNQMVDQDTVAFMERVDPVRIRQRPKQGAHIAAEAISVGHVSYGQEWEKILYKILGGNTVLLIEGADDAIIMDTVKYPARAIQQPETERSVQGSQEAFNEVLLTHMNQIRRYVKTPNLVLENVTVGSDAKTGVCIAYLDGVTNPAIVAAVRRRLAGLGTSGIIGTTAVVSALKDHPWTPFPLARMTERVDDVSYELLQGRVAILVDNTPFQIVVPSSFMDFYRTADDYEGQFWGGSMNRLVRLVGFLVAVFAPGLYIAFVEVNPDLLPTRLLWTIAGSRQNVPFPPLIEVIIMFVVIELLVEASVRLPKNMSQTLGTVGAIVIGTAVVKAGIVSDLMIVVVTITAVGLFTMPSWQLTITLRWLMWPMVVGAYVFGVFGMLLMTILYAQHIASLSSFGVPYMSPLGPLRVPDLGDTFVRVPMRDMRVRPTSLFTLRPRIKPPMPDHVTEPDVPLRAARQRRR